MNWDWQWIVLGGVALLAAILFLDGLVARNRASGDKTTIDQFRASGGAGFGGDIAQQLDATVDRLGDKDIRRAWYEMIAGATIFGIDVIFGVIKYLH